MLFRCRVSVRTTSVSQFLTLRKRGHLVGLPFLVGDCFPEAGGWEKRTKTAIRDGAGETVPTGGGGPWLSPRTPAAGLSPTPTTQFPQEEQLGDDGLVGFVPGWAEESEETFWCQHRAGAQGMSVG